VVVHIVHPESRAPFLFEARALFLDTDPPGVHVELRGVDARFRQDFLEFIRGPIAYDSQVMLEPPGDRDPEAGEGELG
jgi:hypothetical protein